MVRKSGLRQRQGRETSGCPNLASRRGDHDTGSIRSKVGAILGKFVHRLNACYLRRLPIGIAAPLLGYADRLPDSATASGCGPLQGSFQIARDDAGRFGGSSARSGSRWQAYPAVDRRHRVGWPLPIRLPARPYSSELRVHVGRLHRDNRRVLECGLA